MTRKERIRPSLAVPLLGVLAATSPERVEAVTEIVVPSSDGVRLHVREVGSGEPILLLAGGPGISGDYLMPLAEDLARDRRVIVPDARGTGRSAFDPFDPEKISLESFVSDLEAIRISRRIEHWSVLGHSWGGILALAYASLHPGRVRSIVLVGSGGITSEFTTWYSGNIVSRLDADRRAEIGFWQTPERFAKDPERALLEISRATAPAMVLDPDLARELVAETVHPSRFNAKVTLAMQPFLREYDLSRTVSELDVPTLVIQGRQDPVGETTAYQIRDAIRRAELVFVENSAHWPFREQREVFLGHVTGFLSQGRGSR